MAKLRFSVDGGVTFQEAPQGVRVIYESVDVPGEDGLGQLHVNCTSEGMISDVWVTREDPLDHNIGTRSELLSDMVAEMVEQGA